MKFDPDIYSIFDDMKDQKDKWKKKIAIWIDVEIEGTKQTKLEKKYGITQQRISTIVNNEVGGELSRRLGLNYEKYLSEMCCLNLVFTSNFPTPAVD